MIRVEELTARALEVANIDRYVLAIAVSTRADEILNGSPSKLNIDPKSIKASDLALMEIAEGLVVIKGFEKK